MSKKYYRSSFPQCILHLIGVFAGTEDARLVFTLTPKRHFLGEIFIVCPHRQYANRVWKKRLRKDMWLPTSFVSTFIRDAVITKLVRHMYWNSWDNCSDIYKDFIIRVETLFDEVNNYALVFPRKH